MANDFDDFNYDGDDVELDENGLPIEDDEAYSAQDLFDQLREYRENENSSDFDEQENETYSSSSHNDNQENESSDDTHKVTDSREKELNSVDSTGHPKSPEEILQEKMLGAQLSKNKAKMDILYRQLQQMASPPTPMVLQPFQASSLKEAKDLVANKLCMVLHPLKTRELKSLIKKIEKRVLGLKARFWIDKLKPFAPYIAIALGVILLILLLIIVVASVVSAVGAKTDPENMKNNDLITSEYFYGIRVAYLDDEAISNSLNLSYKQYVIDIIENIDEHIEQNELDITINLTLPQIDENNPLTNQTELNSHVSNMSLGIANIVATGNKTYSGVNFNDIEKNILHFGITSQQSSIINEFLDDYFTNNTLLSGESVNVDNLIDMAMTEEDVQYMYNICEKVMIKDEIATADGLNGIEQRNYIGSVYMPNKNIVVSNSSFTIASTSETFTCVSKQISRVNSTDNVVIEQTINETEVIDGIGAGVTLNEFNSIDKTNTSSFAKGISLFDAIKMSSEYINYFAKNTETNIYTWVPNDTNILYYTYNANEIFIFSDFDLTIKSAS